MTKKSGVNLICEERARQKDKLNWSNAHDDDHDDGSLALAAACYAAPERIFIRKEFAASVAFADPWPWADQDSRPYDGNVLLQVSPSPQNLIERRSRVRRLVKAGALIAAEIDRLQRMEGSDEG